MDAHGRISRGAALEDAEHVRIKRDVRTAVAERSTSRMRHPRRRDRPSGMVDQALHRMVERGLLVSKGTGREGDPYL
jgi:hypothetical protein